MNGTLHGRTYPIGGRPELEIIADDESIHKLVDLRDVRERPCRSAVRLFVLGGERLPAMDMPPEEAYPVIMDTGDIIVFGDTKRRWADWYGKARSVVVTEAGIGVIVVPGFSRYNPDFIVRLVIRPVLDSLLAARGYLLLHASAVMTPGGVCIVAGHAGTGKTTLLGRLLNAGFPFVGDDRVLAKRHKDGGILVSALPEYIRAGIDDTAPKRRMMPSLVHTEPAKPRLVVYTGSSEQSGGIREIGSAEAAGRILDLTPFARTDPLFSDAFDTAGALAETARHFLVGWWGDPVAREKAVLEVIAAMTGPHP